MTNEPDALEEILTKMVENTYIIVTNDLSRLLEQDRVAEIRCIHKDEILKNIPKAKAALETLILDTQIKELEYVLAHSSGGGDWRRIIHLRIDELKEGKI